MSARISVLCASVSPLTHIGIITGLDGVVALQLSTGPVGVTLGASQVSSAAAVGLVHELPWRPAVQTLAL